jgi:2-iminobutanoate/2-iminopropanoate deaminase
MSSWGRSDVAPRFIELAEAGGTPSPYSEAVVSEGVVYVAGQLAQDEPEWRGGSGTIEEETKTAMDRIGRILAAAGAGYGDIVRVGVFMTDLSESARMNAVYLGYFPPGKRPARTCVGVASLISGARIEIDCIARVGSRVSRQREVEADRRSRPRR